MNPAIHLRDAEFPADLLTVRTLFREYAASLTIDLCFQGFEQELAGLPGWYAPPAGRLFLATRDQEVAGCVGLRPLDAAICEMKRLYVRPPFRRLGCGRLLAQAAIEAGKMLGYQRMRLDTLASMTQALALYAALGFQRIGPYYANPDPSVVFMELALRQKTAGQAETMS